MLEPGEYANITGNTATAWGLIAASLARAAPVPRHLPDHPGLGHPPRAVEAQAVRGADFQAEDEISGIGAALGAAFGGALGVTTTSRPGIDLKSETMGLAISLELRS